MQLQGEEREPEGENAPPPETNESKMNDKTEITDGMQGVIPKFKDERPIHLFSDEELWAELKRRGFSGSITKTVTFE